MKKVLCVLLTALLLLSATACSAPENNGTVSKPGSATTPTQQTAVMEPTQGTQNNEEALTKMQFPKMAMYCMVPEKCTRKTNGKIVCTTDDQDYIATIFNGDKGSFTGDMSDILTASADKYAGDVNKYLSTNIDGAELKAQTTENVTVSGYEAVRFSGQIKNIKEDNYKIYGYSMIIDERPVMFLGILASEGQVDTELNGMKALIDQMAGSIFE